MRVVFLLCLILSQVRASAVFDVYLQVSPTSSSQIAGAAVDPLYAGWIEVSAFESGLARPAAVGAPTTIMPFTLVKTADPATVVFFDKVTAGAHLLTIEMVIALRTPNRIEMWDITGTSSLFTAQTFVATAGGSVEERISFDVEKIEWSYIQVGASGDPVAEYFANWNAATATGASGVRAPSYPGGVDTDGDGIPDGWELFYGLNRNVADASLDTDGDGLDNLREFIAHTNPLSPNSTLRITAVQKSGVSLYGLTWTSVKGLTYRILSAPAPGGPYTHIQTVPSAGDGTTSTTIVAPVPPLFLRVAVP